jgi:hypothetical protein
MNSSKKLPNLNNEGSEFLWGGEATSFSPPVNTLATFLRTRWFMLRDSSRWFKPEGISSNIQIFNEWFGLLGYPHHALMPTLRLHLRPDICEAVIRDAREFEMFSSKFFHNWEFPEEISFFINGESCNVKPLNIFHKFFCSPMDGMDLQIIGKVTGLPKSYMSYIPKGLINYYKVNLNGAPGILGLNSSFENPLGFSSFETAVFFDVDFNGPYELIDDLPEVSCVVPVQLFKSQKNIEDFFQKLNLVVAVT